MMTTMLVICGIVIGSLLLMPRPNATPLASLDVASAAVGARERLGFEPSVPVGLEGWTATTATVRRDSSGILTWHLSYLTPEGRYAGVDQADRSTHAWENSLDEGGVKVGTVVINGETWDRMFHEERALTSLILRHPGRVTLVTAKAGGVVDAERLIQALNPRP